MAKTLNLTLKVWRQENREAKGRIETYAAKDIPVDASFLEMLDIVNEGLVKEGKEPIHFDHDCREGICGMCSLTIKIGSGEENVSDSLTFVESEQRNHWFCSFVSQQIGYQLCFFVIAKRLFFNSHYAVEIICIGLSDLYIN